MSVLSNKVFKKTVTVMFKELKAIVFKESKESRRVILIN